MTNPLTPEVLADPVALTRALVDIESVSGNEKEIADCVEEVLRGAPHLDVERYGHTLMARTDLGRRAAGGAGRSPRHRADRRQPPVPRRRRPHVRLRHLRHEVRAWRSRCTWR